MSRVRALRRWTAVAVLATACPAGCSRHGSNPAPLEGPSPSVASVTPAATSPSSAAAPAPPPPRSELDAGSRVEDRLAALFARFVDDSDFEFLRDLCGSPVDVFDGLERAEIDVVISTERTFFHDKRMVHYTPDLRALKQEIRGDSVVVRLPVTASWGTEPPEEWGFQSGTSPRAINSSPSASSPAAIASRNAAIVSGFWLR